MIYSDLRMFFIFKFLVIINDTRIYCGVLEYEGCKILYIKILAMLSLPTVLSKSLPMSYYNHVYGGICNLLHIQQRVCCCSMTLIGHHVRRSLI